MTKDAIEETLAKYNRGLIMVFTGDGKGKTTAALGQALRALGHGKKVLVVQFMKGRKYGEVLCAEQCLPNLTFNLCGLDSFVMRGNPAPVDVELAREGFNLGEAAIQSGEFDMVILDELNIAIDFGLIPLQERRRCPEGKGPEGGRDPHGPLRPEGDCRPCRHGERGEGDQASL